MLRPIGDRPLRCIAWLEKGIKSRDGGWHRRHGGVRMLASFVVYFRCKNPGDKKPGGLKQYRLYANSLEEARRLAAGYANYPEIEIISVCAA